MTTSEDDRDLLAAEYVLGTLDADDRANVQMLLAIDPEFAETIGKWERRLGELHQLVDQLEPPAASWDRIQARIANAPPTGKLWLPTAEDLAKAPAAPKPAPEISEAEARAAAEVKAPNAEIISLTERVRLWRGRTVMAGALAACVAALLAAREFVPGLMPPPRIVEKPVEVIRTVEVPVPSQRMAEFVAVFQKDDASPAFLLTVDVERRTLSVRKVGAEQPPDKSYQLWILPAGATAPRSLGLLEEREFTVRRALADYDGPTLSTATFGISLEPQGGSPTGGPTGPVLHGKLLQTAPAGFPSATP
jgi:anti-sigma-K factor RskA